MILRLLPIIFIYSSLLFASGTNTCLPETLNYIHYLERKQNFSLERVPENYFKNFKNFLIKEFVDDGRPILVVTDSRWNQKSGVVTVMKVLTDEVEKLSGKKIKLKFITPDEFPGFNVKYQDLRFSYLDHKKFKEILKAENPQAIHLMVEGALGAQARDYLISKKIPFTTAYHTEMPPYVEEAVKKIAGHISESGGKLINESAIGSFIKKAGDFFGKGLNDLTSFSYRHFHSYKLPLDATKRGSRGVLVPTESMAKKLIDSGYDARQIRYWSHGVNTELFNPSYRNTKLFKEWDELAKFVKPENVVKYKLEEEFKLLKQSGGPYSLFIGRVAPEKNLIDFLKMETPGTKVIVGDGPDLEIFKAMRARGEIKNAVFLGSMKYEDLPVFYASSDVFVFPSLTDTFGLVQLEAAATGTPVIAYKVQGPIDVINSPNGGRLAEHIKGADPENVKRLEAAWNEAIKIDRKKVREFAEANTWEKSSLEFMYFLHRLPPKQIYK